MTVRGGGVDRPPICKKKNTLEACEALGFLKHVAAVGLVGCDLAFLVFLVFENRKQFSKIRSKQALILSIIDLRGGSIN